jgi:hypothetical protein
MNNRQLKKLAAEKHNEAYLESLKPKPPRPDRVRTEAEKRAARSLGICMAISASVMHY